MIIVTKEEENYSYKTEFIEKRSGFCFMFKKTFRSTLILFNIVEIQFIYYKIFYFEVYNSVGFSIFTKLCSYHQYLNQEYFHHPTRKPFSSQFTPHPLITTNLFPVSIDVPILDVHKNGVI